MLDPHEQQRLRCKQFYSSVLRCALDDLDALLVDAPMPGDDKDHPMTLEQRMELFGDTLHFFLNPKPSICSLDVICDALEIRAGRIRSRVREVLHYGGEIGMPARRLLVSGRNRGDLVLPGRRRVVDATGRSVWHESRQHQEGADSSSKARERLRVSGLIYSVYLADLDRSAQNASGGSRSQHKGESPGGIRHGK